MKYISLFSGAMGLDLGLERAGFVTAACNEISIEAVETIRTNKPNLAVSQESIVNLTGKDLLALAKLKKVRLVVGGPPCQAFSVFGKRQGLADSRGKMVFEFIRIISETQPDVFLMENVRGLLSMPLFSPKEFAEGEDLDPKWMEKGSLVEKILAEFNSIGYRVDCFVVNSVNYGAPQIRERLLFIGNRHGIISNMPEPQFSNRTEDNLPPFRTLGDAIGKNFIDPCPEVMNFSPRKLEYLSMIPPGGNWRSLPLDVQKESMGKSWFLKGGRSAYWRKLSFAFPSPTVVTMPNHAGTSMCHPLELRAISVGEAAAIQEFPRDWKFCGSTTSKFRQVGNAVPTRLGEVAGQAIKAIFSEIEKHKRRPLTNFENRIIHLRPHVRTRQFWKNGQAIAGDVSYYADEEETVESNTPQFEFELSN
ncbi:DNA cytosine methyltransferase [Rugamonas sp. DEMB1]|uniref:DNA cytosine methyltransferase n=1 Tax=Rugamonas sp. DEMB1 TaxID=3039386 RepID=UPI0024473B5F|nr:DNA cytosine methyltransferase [Rugamonas sp. DEMB1]WGG50746.1 DNA cytosine methyltransferase [Rugamonas sp. DEMB1]